MRNHEDTKGTKVHEVAFQNAFFVRLRVLRVFEVSQLIACRQRWPAASRNDSNSGRNSPVLKKFSGCHWTPRQKRALGSSIASMTPSGAVAETMKPGATVFT